MNNKQIKLKEDRIKRIVKGLDSSIKKFGRFNLPFSFKIMKQIIQATFNCTPKTAREYTNISLFKFGLDNTNLSHKEDYTNKLEIPDK